MLTDIRCGCGGLCDSRELCPMRNHVEACGCGYSSITHARGQQGCCYFGGYDWQTDPLGCNGPLNDEASSCSPPTAP
jgi:hypothetical protein